MANYGAILVDEYGIPFSTPDTTPMSLISKNVYNFGGSGGVINLAVSVSSPFVVAFKSDVTGVYGRLDNNGGAYTLTVGRLAGGSVGNVTVYIFGIVIPQPKPAWGIAINDAQGRCILTNETKVMNPPIAVGTPGNPANLGYNVDTTLSGNYAVMPQMTGLMVGVIHSGGATRPFQSPIQTYAYFNGSTTRISSTQTDTPGGDQLENVGYANSNDVVYALDVSAY